MKSVAEAQARVDAAAAALDQARQHLRSAIARRRDIAAELRTAERHVTEASKEIQKALMRQKRESMALGAAKRESQRRSKAGRITERQK